MKVKTKGNYKCDVFEHGIFYWEKKIMVESILHSYIF